MEKTEIRLFTPADRDWLIDVHQETYTREEGFDDTFGPLVAQIVDDFIADHNPVDERGWIAWQGDVRLGSIFCVRLDERRAKLRLFQLVPAARGLGLGRQLLEACTGFAQQQGYDGMQLWTHKSHEAACALYLRNGWRIVEEKPVVSFGVPLIEQTLTLSWDDLPVGNGQYGKL
ncbi:GNAT family N-acetyltransferase [uncultured Sulfitobacter sp.]|uniref:GNAT family N-acetyltransferase n=1 Tax=uncultured Sulfitobacter sp. TaxID=191468 RepID=UPI0026230712|nr:GNAT family N-acetyltransferase [uncultured Sulfitobacter sp.]